MDSRKILAGAIVLPGCLAAWIFRYESYGYQLSKHRNRFTGTVCESHEECWFSSTPYLVN
jgi:hypothetical protein